jgi:hypothetical protein
LNSEESDKQNDLILNAIEQRVALRNKKNAAKMAQGNAVPAAKIHEQGAIVSLLIPGKVRKKTEVRRVMCRVIEYSRSGYQLNTEHGLIKGRWDHKDLNSSSLDIPEILMLTQQEAKKTHKVELATIVALMNNRGTIRAENRARRKRTRA